MNNWVAVIRDLLFQFNGIDTNGFEEAFFMKCVQNRMSKTSSNSLNGYCNLLKSNKEETHSLVNSLNNTFSEFFRNTLTFAYLEQIVLPSLIEKKRKEKQKEIRIWSAIVRRTGKKSNVDSPLSSLRVQTSTGFRLVSSNH